MRCGGAGSRVGEGTGSPVGRPLRDDGAKGGVEAGERVGRHAGHTQVCPYEVTVCARGSGVASDTGAMNRAPTRGWA